jgi:uncharacterized protein with PIN domain
VVIDSAAMLAILFDEPAAAWALDRMQEEGRLLMSPVNLSEVLIRTTPGIASPTR